jgi:MarR-like DNA-binding transcriptional regulator SgrR of sgrS sRNA
MYAPDGEAGLCERAGTHQVFGGHKRTPQSEQSRIFLGAENRGHFCDARQHQRGALITPRLARACQEVVEAQSLGLERLEQRLKLWVPRVNDLRAPQHSRTKQTLTYAALSKERLAVSKNVLAPLAGEAAAVAPAGAASR